MGQWSSGCGKKWDAGGCVGETPTHPCTHIHIHTGPAGELSNYELKESVVTESE